MKIILTIVYSLGVVWNILFLAVNVGRIPVINLLWPAVILVACAINLYFLWTRKQESESMSLS
ncbi:hypothetical protein [Streptococcus suis]|uniref:Integral membrane protein n=3 Tax=Streptococcus suis TaxID=1307 RepID=A0AB37G3U9_STRSU|nr:hypothetical protein [Streptococcus suis]AER18285.1 hypothetical protein SSUD9_2129 [Streptococcus suis D9]MBM6437256.1 hypothetical protein [Streptococcus suis]MCB2854565.1 hypothetical protein [Streptococcus suis]MCB2856354.1 hypothetical protein [Streptococcus suis]MCB2877120.1 hypothetical protein [Streptococcus suis]